MGTPRGRLQAGASSLSWATLGPREPGAYNGSLSTGQRAAAAEILNRVREEVATRNAMHARGA